MNYASKDWNWNWKNTNEIQKKERKKGLNNYIRRSRDPRRNRTEDRWARSSRTATMARAQLSPGIQCSPAFRGRTLRRPAPSPWCRAILAFLSHHSQQPWRRSAGAPDRIAWDAVRHRSLWREKKSASQICAAEIKTRAWGNPLNPSRILSPHLQSFGFRSVQLPPSPHRRAVPAHLSLYCRTASLSSLVRDSPKGSGGTMLSPQPAVVSLFASGKTKEIQ